MDKAREALTVGEEDSRVLTKLEVRPHRAGDDASFYEGFALRGLRVETISPGYLSCSFKVPPRLTDRNGNMSLGAIANLVDEVGGAAMHADGHHMKVSVDISISFLANAKLHDELEITSRVLGHRGSYYTGTYVLLRNKTSGEVIAEGRHSLFGNLRSKI
ncbi:acyl-coenzyme A thioesterase 13 isoform X1 [Dendrobium catenatum]|uniref:Acyl-coenzyme A thioesterase 13 n=2 Tax=Dendrobium TaxID=37818 RepID=A0A8T3AQJ9_DENNO|nr:acyl-coenzyme A thioesterase 13 isoform X1 [Dendrobium catenatum]KAI0498417.1 hypothetical protein KFK09_021659 [Dendrobium nobile]PKU78968.1 hypothetical protein MA16_Dca000312 [Dendrobium catenatum]